MPEFEVETESRFGEVELFLSFLRELERNARLSKTQSTATSQAAPVLKACTFLLLYNVVESTVRAAFGRTYEQISTDGITFLTSTTKIQELWLKQQLDVPTDTAIHQTYVNQATKIAMAVSRSDVFELESRKLPISGNLDAEKIRDLCRRHGFELKVSKFAKGGQELDTIKAQRNALSHGHKTFSECGREYATKDLQRIFLQARHFLRGFSRSVRSFNDADGYRR